MKSTFYRLRSNFSVINGITLSLLLGLLNVGCVRAPHTQVARSIENVSVNTTNMPIYEGKVVDLSVANSPNGISTIKIPDYVDETDPDTVFKSYKFIPLETKDECLIGKIDKILFHKNRIFILDERRGNAFVFDDMGKFLCRLGETGRGPGEHLSAKDLSLDIVKKRITLLDTSGQKLLHYDLDGKFLEEEPSYFQFSNIEYDGPRLVLNTGRNYNNTVPEIDLHRLIIARRDQKPIARGFKISEDVRQNWFSEPTIQLTSHGIMFNDLLSDTIWQINDCNITPFAVIRKDGKPTFTDVEKAHMSEPMYIERKDAGNMTLSFCISDNYMFVNIVTSKEETGGRNVCNSVFYSFTSGVTKRFGYYLHIANKFGHYFNPQLPNVVADGDIFCCVLEPARILTVAQQDYAQKVMMSEEKAMVKNLTPESNPVLMLEELIDF